LYSHKSLLNNKWKIKNCDERKSLMISQRHNLSLILGKLLTLRNVKDEEVQNFLSPIFVNNIPNPFDLKDMHKSINRTIKNIINKKKIGIIADYDVDGSTSAALLHNFLSFFNCSISLKIPDRLNEGYGPNIRIMDEFIKEKINLVFSLDCGTTSFEILDHPNYKEIDVIIIDHHISENKLPNIYSIINPNRFDEKSKLKDLAAVGVTFLFIIGLRRILRENNYFDDKKSEPNLLENLDLVALGTVCDVVNLSDYNRNFVIKGLDIIKKRTHKGISQIIDNSNINHSPTATDLSFFVGPQLNAASRVDDSSLSHKLLISNNLIEIETITKKIFLLNEKRKLIESNVYDQALEQAKKQINKKFILVYGLGWHKGILGIIASRLVEKFNKPVIVISFDQNIGIGSARSIKQIDLGNIILLAKQEDLLLSGGGHKMAAGLKIQKNLFDKFYQYLLESFEQFSESLFQKVNLYDVKLSVDEINLDLLENLENLEPFGNGNEEPKFVVQGLKINHCKVLKENHLLIFFRSDSGTEIKGISFNSFGTNLGENLINNKSSKFDFGCSIKKDYFNDALKPQLIIEDAMLVN
jgi:single-stranded-DNA-specific exonuclease